MKSTPSAPPKKRGRPASGRARTGAQRSAALRERAKTLVFEDGSLSEVNDTCLLEAFGLAYRAHMRFEVERIGSELLRRAAQHNAVTGTTVEPVVVVDKTVTTTDKPAPRGYPQEVRAMALTVASRGEALSAIRAVLAACDQTPDAETWARVLSTWQQAAQD